MLEIESITTTPYHPQSNGTVERFHGTLVPMLRKAITKHLDWPLYLPMCLFAVRESHSYPLYLSTPQLKACSMDQEKLLH